MAFRALRKAGYDDAVALAARVREQAEALRDSSAAGPVSLSEILGLHDLLATTLVRWTAIAQISGLAAYVQAQEGDPAYNVGAEFTAMASAAEGTADWIEANVPKDAQDRVGTFTFEADHSRSVPQFTTAQTAGLRTQLDLLIATIV